jgi:hypothetical protein
MKPNDASKIPTAAELYLSPLLSDNSLQEELERRFFASVRLHNGTYKFTYSRRLDDLNSLVNPLLPSGYPLKIMDVAVSSGVSTLEWAESLSQSGIKHDMTAGDLTATGFLISVGRGLHVLIDKRGYPLQFDVFGRPVPNPPGGRNLLRYFLPLALIRASLAISFPAISEGCTVETGIRVNSLGIKCRPITLTSPRLKRSANLHVVDDDILNNRTLARSFDVLRAANILNRDYFADEILLRMLDNLRSRLLPGGILVICTTEDAGDNHGSIFKLNERGGFDAVARLSGGSTIEDLVLGLKV